MSDEQDDNVIHVTFGSGVEVRDVPADGTATEAPSGTPGDPLTELYGRAEVARLFALSEGRLRYWDDSEFLSPSVTHEGRRYYSFQDLISIRAAKGLLDEGIPLQRVRRSVDALRVALPRVARPLTQMRVLADGAALVVQDAEGRYEPHSGQTVLDFSVGTLSEQVVRTLRPDPAPRAGETAYGCYLEGCRLDEDESTVAEAEACYRRAIALDPGLATAYTNLGNLVYRRGAYDEARDLGQRALRVDANQPEAHYNLGYLHLDDENYVEAERAFSRAIALDGEFADAHFNHALALEQLERHDEARVSWESYLAIESSGTWADIARSHLARP